MDVSGKVGDLVRHMFAKKGTIETPPGKAPDLRCLTIPVLPVDTFAAVAVLIRRSGAYQYMREPNCGNGSEPGRLPDDPFGVCGHNRDRLREIAALYGSGLQLKFEKAGARKIAMNTAREYFGVKLTAAKSQAHAKELQDLWRSLVRCEDPVLAKDAPDEEDPETRSELPEWWTAAMKLLIISDEASRGVGFHVDEAEVKTKVYPIAQASLAQRAISDFPEDDVVAIHSATHLFDNSIAAVLPKTRTPELGCTLRALTHNLALLPSSGRVRTKWYWPKERPLPATVLESDSRRAGQALNLLLIPFPFQIDAPSFSPVDQDLQADATRGAFEVDQRWLNYPQEDATKRDKWFSDFSNYVEHLIHNSLQEGVTIHGVVFPELSLNSEIFNKLAEELFARFEQSLEFIIAGVSTRRTQTSRSGVRDGPLENGNYVAIRGILKLEKEAKNQKRRTISLERRKEGDYQAWRSKHHRWRLDGRQIERYALSHQLDPDKYWWENIRIGARELDIFQPRAGTTMTTLICEDLARIDPCQEVIRAIGPNLVIALLMDGPQIDSRWPSHYAGVLADDPGCSVLTLTSYGLIGRSSASSGDSRKVIFWKNSEGQRKEITLPVWGDAIALRLVAGSVTETTMDGRSDGGRSYVWRLADSLAISIDESKKQFLRES